MNLYLVFCNLVLPSKVLPVLPKVLTKTENSNKESQHKDQSSLIDLE